MAEKRYWSVVECGWVPCPGAPDMLATPWGVAARKAPAERPEPPDRLERPEVPGQRAPSPQQADTPR